MSGELGPVLPPRPLVSPWSRGLLPSEGSKDPGPNLGSGACHLGSSVPQALLENCCPPPGPWNGRHPHSLQGPAEPALPSLLPPLSPPLVSPASPRLRAQRPSAPVLLYLCPPPAASGLRLGTVSHPDWPRLLLPARGRREGEGRGGARVAQGGPCPSASSVGPWPPSPGVRAAVWGNAALGRPGHGCGPGNSVALWCPL